MTVLLLLIGLALILVGANYLTDGAAAVAKRFRVPEFVVGLTVVAIGTSTPELVVSVLSALAGKSEMAIGNVVGSNVFNTFVIVGICALIRPMPLTRSNIRRDIPFGMIGSVLLLLVACDRFIGLGDTNQIDRAEGICMFLLYVLLLIYTVRHAERPAEPADPNDPAAAPGMRMWLAAVMIVGGLGALIGGGELFLHAATKIARHFGVSDSVIAITLVAGGTSLPELASSVVSLAKGRAEMALGHVLGSNIANILLILGLSATVHPLTLGGITPVDLGVVVLGSVLLFVSAFTFRRKAIDRVEGSILLAIYIAYLGYLLSK